MAAWRIYFISPWLCYLGDLCFSIIFAHYSYQSPVLTAALRAFRIKIHYVGLLLCASRDLGFMTGAFGFLEQDSSFFVLYSLLPPCLRPIPIYSLVLSSSALSRSTRALCFSPPLPLPIPLSVLPFLTLVWSPASFLRPSTYPPSPFLLPLYFP